jgi:MFS family permease
VLTLQVVLGLRQGYAAAGLVAGAATVGTAVGAPILGRIVDRRGLRPMLVITILAEAVFWALAPWMPYPALLVAAAVGGLLALPVFTVVRQSLAALVPEAQRRTAYSLDSMSVEVSFMIGPVLGVLVATQVSTTAAMLAVGGLIVPAGVALYLLNPPVRGDPGAAGGAAALPWRDWLGARLVAVLLATSACALVLSGTEVAIVAALQGSGQVSWTGLVIALWCLASLVGGFIYGAMRRGLSELLLAVLIGVCTIPIGLFGYGWWVLSLAIIPAGMLCAPTLAALADAVSRLAPESVRGLVMGVHGSALTVGLAAGAPLSGAVVDASAPVWAFAVVGASGALLGAVALGVSGVAAPASATADRAAVVG